LRQLHSTSVLIQTKPCVSDLLAVDVEMVDLPLEFTTFIVTINILHSLIVQVETGKNELNKKTNVAAIVAPIVVCVVIAVVAGGVFYKYRMWKKLQPRFQKEEELQTPQPSKNKGEIVGDFIVDIQITESIGSGAFGEVYKGDLGEKVRDQVLRCVASRYGCCSEKNFEWAN
jgi:hypothetical protein